MHFTYSGGDLIWKNPSNSQTVQIQCVFFYDKYLVETVHLLEHLLLNPHRFADKKETVELDFVHGDDLINGYTSGIFVSLTVMCHVDDAFSYREKLKKIILSPLNISIDQIENEMNIIEHEHLYLDKDLFTTGYTYQFREQDKDYIHDIITTDLMHKAHKDIVTDNSCLLLLRGNIDSTKVIKVKKDMAAFLQNRNTDYPKHSKKSFSYHPKIIVQEKESTHEICGSVLYSATTGLMSEREYLMHLFNMVIVKKYLFHFLRNIEGTNYDISGNFRTTPYGWEQFYEFMTHHKAHKIIQLLKDLPKHIEQQFEKYKQIVIKNIIISILGDSYFSLYYTTQLFYFSHSYLTPEDIEQIMEKFTKEEFIIFYKNWLQKISYVTESGI